MPNDVANNMADTIHFLEEENASIMKSLTDLQFAYNEQMIELREAKRLLKLAVKDFRRVTKGCLGIQCDSCPHIATFNGCVWQYAAAAEKICRYSEAIKG